MKYILALSLFALATHASAHGHCSLEGGKTAFDRWQSAFVASDLNGIVSLYTPDAVLNATLNNEPIVDQKGRAAYFKGLFEKLSERSVSFDTPHTRVVGDAVVSSGVWTFRGKNPKGEAQILRARTSFLYGGSDCKIIDHHSSLFPIPDQAAK